MPQESALVRKYGWIPDKKDDRDHRLELPPDVELAYPPSFSMEQFCGPVMDQGQLGSCTGNGIAGAIQTRMNALNYKWKFTPSRLFVYYNERVIEGSVDQDAGAEIRDGFKTINEQGVCPESEGDGTNPNWLWPYSDDQQHFKQKPSDACYKDAVMHKCVKYMLVPQDRDSIKGALAAGYPVVIGIQVHQSFESAETAKTGVVKTPGWAFLDPVLGGHCLYLHSYGVYAPDYASGRNSWGESWGDKGNFHIPFDYLCNPSLASDFWAVELVG